MNRPLQTVLRAILQQLFHMLSQTAVGVQMARAQGSATLRSFPGLCGRWELQLDALQSARAPDTRRNLHEQGGHQRTFKSPPNQSPS